MDRYLKEESGTEFDNWQDANYPGDKWLPGQAWKIRHFVSLKPPSGVLGEAVLKIDPYRLPSIDFTRESGNRRSHYREFIIEVTPTEVTAGTWWSATFLIETSAGQTTRPMWMHATCDSRDRAIGMALSQAEGLIDSGVSLPEANVAIGEGVG